MYNIGVGVSGQRLQTDIQTKGYLGGREAGWQLGTDCGLWN
jgi:hypothetical protein